MSINAAIAERLALMSKLLDLLGEDSFRASAHARAARAIADIPQDLEPLAKAPDAKKRLQEFEGIGPKMADKIIEFAKTGQIAELDALRAKVPPTLLPLMDVPGLGPKTIAVLWNQGGVTSLADLKRIIADGSILSLPRMGEKAVAKLKESIAQAESFGAGGEQRMPLGVAVPAAERIVEALRAIPGVKHIAYAGSARRGKDTVGDLDILVAMKAGADCKPVSKAFLALPHIKQTILAGETKCSVRLIVSPNSGRWTASDDASEPSAPTVQADLRVVDEPAWGAALMYFTGSKEHNVLLRTKAQKMGLTLNEYGLFPEDDAANEKEAPQHRGIKPVAAAMEEEIYRHLGFEWIPPEIREGRGELEVYARPESAELIATASKTKKGKSKTEPAPKPAKSTKETPAHTPPTRLIEITDIKAELHAHTTASDGNMEIEQLAAEAMRRGFHTIAVTDHSKSSAIAGGLTPERLLEHIEAVHRVRDKLAGKIQVLVGSEVDILADGSLDYDDKLLAKLDIVVCSPHAGLKQDPATSTARLLKVIRHPLVHIIGHPTGRIINRRAGMSPDIHELAAAAKEHNVALEINADWHRLDLRDVHTRVVMETGGLIAIDCDTHAAEDMDNLRYGILTARRGWVTPDRCINTWDAKKLLAWLKAKR
jgi:DNA polymerase (family 10)